MIWDDKKFKKTNKIQLEEEVKRLNEQKFKQMQINLSTGGLGLSTPQKEEKLYDNYAYTSQVKGSNPMNYGPDYDSDSPLVSREYS